MSPIYKNGKYGYSVKINYKDATTGKYKQILRCNEHTRTKNDAKNYELELLAQVTNGNDASTLSFVDLYYKFLSERGAELKSNTLKNYKFLIPTYVFPLFENKKIDTFTKEDAIRWKNWINKNYPNLSTLYKNNIFRHFNAVMNYGVKLYDMRLNPLEKVTKFKNPDLVVEDDIDYWTYEEFKTFIRCLNRHLEQQEKKNDILRWSALKTCYYVLFFGGLRKSEALALNWKDIITINGKEFINVYKSVNQYVTPYEITSTKNKSSVRKVPICNELKEALQEHKERCMEIYSFDENTFFICGNINPLPKNSVGEVKADIEKECGVHHIRVHDLRHSFCSLLINGGFPLSTIAKLLGHSTTDITQKVYSHIYPNSNDDVIAFMNNLGTKKDGD